MDGEKLTIIASTLLALIIALILIVDSIKSFVRLSKLPPEERKSWLRVGLSVLGSIACIVFALNYLNQVVSLFK